VLKFLHGYTVILHYSLVLGPLAGGQQYIYWYDYKSLYFKILFFMVVTYQAFWMLCISSEVDVEEKGRSTQVLTLFVIQGCAFTIL
jgi:hypothetical protein